MLKMCAPVIREYLAFCFNKCIEKKIFPDSVKLAEVNVLVKNGVKNNQSKYRPIIFYLQYAKGLREASIYNKQSVDAFFC